MFVCLLLCVFGVEGCIKSFSYVVMESYELFSGVGIISYFDFYCFGDLCEWEDVGFCDVFVVFGFKFCEWFEKVVGQLLLFDLQFFIELMFDDSCCVCVVGVFWFVEVLV